ncbi:MAG: formate hydrogenase [Acidimicrobiaceae bacterium]|nr:formate hydrogenase [Acidimicrobiaceae bacterium]
MIGPDLFPPAGNQVGLNRSAEYVSGTELESQARELFNAGFRLALVSCTDEGDRLTAVHLFLAGQPDRRVELRSVIDASHPTLPSLGNISFPAGRFEREMHDLFGVIPTNHPHLRPLVRHPQWPSDWYPMLGGQSTVPDFNSEWTPFNFLTVDGVGVYEIPVGPVHAGIIEPGHFRFSVVGETILKLKARLWFVHRGVEKLFEGRLVEEGIEVAERISGDTAVGHALAYSCAIEDALGLDVGQDSRLLRVILLEMERIYNHVSDLGALANDVGFGIINAHAQRIRERLLQINLATTGHRLLRGSILPGETKVISIPEPAQLREILADIAEVSALALSNSTVMDRFSGTAALSRLNASELGCLGYVGRASGIDIDARRDHPTVSLTVEGVLRDSGDVLGRFLVRRDEISESVRLIESALELLQSSEQVVIDGIRAKGDGSGVGISEGWRGTIVHRVELTDSRITRLKVVDPSWFNWPALPVALKDTIVPDFPLTNKSFNLSYAGNDL